MVDANQNIYPLMDFIGLIEQEVVSGDGSTEKHTLKCTHNAAASIAMTCAEIPYEGAVQLLNQLAGLELTVMTAFRVTDSVGSEFIKDVPACIDPKKIAKRAKKMKDNALETRISEMSQSENIDEIIKKALKDGPEGILYKDYDGPTIKALFVEADGSGIHGRPVELMGVKGKQSDGSAKTFEGKIGAVFMVDFTSDGRPLLTENGEIHRNKDISYMGTTRRSKAFGAMLYRHALENGLKKADAVVFLGDGAKWLWGIQKTFFPTALCVIDIYHAIERANALVDLLSGLRKKGEKQAFKDKCIALLKAGNVQEMIELIETQTCLKKKEKKLNKALDYFRKNIERMNYGLLSACGIFIGSGVIEAGCKVIIGSRMKNAGMHWLKDHAEKMIALRCAIRNGVFLKSYLHDQTPHDIKAVA